MGRKGSRPGRNQDAGGGQRNAYQKFHRLIVDIWKIRGWIFHRVAPNCNGDCQIAAATDKERDCFTEMLLGATLSIGCSPDLSENNLATGLDSTSSSISVILYSAE